jgi:hypothetical protein
MAFARYVVSQERDPFPKSGPVLTLIEASLPELYKSAALVAVRGPAENARSELQVLQLAGDETVAAEVIDRYFTLRQKLDQLPMASIAVMPANYKFHFGGEVRTGGGAAYIYDVTPKKKRPGLVSGQLWIDAATGRELLLSGHLSDIPATAGLVDVVRETTLMNGSPIARVTHVAFTIPRLGRAELAITEMVSGLDITPLSE